MSIDDYEIAHSISVLERNGYIVRKPSEADVPVVLKVLSDELWRTVDVRADALINGETCALIERFPIELVLGQDPKFREQHLPHIIGRKLGSYIADKLAADLALQVEEKINPLVPKVAV